VKTGKTHVLASEHDYIIAAPTSTAHVPLKLPSNLIEFGAYASRVTFIVSVVAVNGAPTTWSLGLKFQYGMPSSADFIYSSPRWFDLQSANVAANIVEGVGWGYGSHAPPADGSYGIIADQTDAPSTAAPITVQRTVRDFGQRVRLALQPKFTGGTNPSINATILAIATE